MELEDRVEALEYLVCLLIQELGVSTGPLSGINHRISEGLFMSGVDSEKRAELVEAIRLIQNKVRARPSLTLR